MKLRGALLLISLVICAQAFNFHRRWRDAFKNNIIEDIKQKLSVLFSVKVKDDVKDEYVATELCPVNDGIFAYSDDCTKFVICKHGKPAVYQCPEGEAFYEEIELCQEYENKSRGTIKEENCTDGKYLHHEDCDKYYECYDNRVIIQKCPQGQNFDYYVNECVDQENALCYPSSTTPSEAFYDTEMKNTMKEELFALEDFECPDSNGVYSSPNDCQKFILCVNDKVILQQCPESMIYSEDLSRCVPGDVYNCQQETTPDSEKNADTKIDYAMWECPVEGGDYPYQEDCTKFLRCRKRTMELLSCKEGQIFNSWLGCVKGDAASCKRRHNCTVIENGLENIHDFKCPSPYGKFADFYDCTTYYECKFYVAKLLSCKPGENFDHLTCQCMNAENATCVFPCREPNGRFAYEGSCERYVECKNNKPQVKICEEGKYFSRRIEECVERDISGCRQSVFAQPKPLISRNHWKISDM